MRELAHCMPLHPPRNIAVLGAGITGLAAAFHLARTLPPTSRITLVEQQDRIGGWIHTERSHVNSDGVGIDQSVLLESGPRTIRPNSLALLELVRH